jgi:hypothetical protein
MLEQVEIFTKFGMDVMPLEANQISLIHFNFLQFITRTGDMQT